MTTHWMGTIPCEQGIKRRWKLFIETNDIHKWIIGQEIGKNGYQHYQVRFSARDIPNFFDTIKTYFPKGHFEIASDNYDYEKKEGHYWCSEDGRKVRECRFGEPDNNQRRILTQVRKQSDRGITVVHDSKGNIGKSWLCRHLFERGQAYYVPPTVDTVKGLIQFVASGYRNEKIVIIDIPRSWKWSEQLYTAIESIKDGLVYDTRYSAKTRDIWGVKILVLTNTLPKIGALSIDRWDIIDVTEWPRNEHKGTRRPLGRIGKRRAHKRARKQVVGETVPMAEVTPFTPPNE